MRRQRWALAWVTGGVLLGVAAGAQASTITFALTTTFSGTAPSGSPTVTLTDTAAGVEVSVSSFPLSGTEFIDDVYLNYTGDVSLLSASYLDGVLANNVYFGDNAFKADGDGYFDILIDYPPPPGSAGTFTADQTSTYLFFTLAGLNTSMFNTTSFCQTGCGTGSYYAAAHIQGLAGGLSAWVGDGDGFPPPPPPPPPPEPVPEPASLLLMGAGLTAFAARYRKRLAASKPSV